jgi:UDP-N-acetylmuramoylalanine--D-glutamate ligase
MQLQGQHVLILGLGASGLAMARWCVRAGADVTVADTRDAPPQLAALQADCPSVRFVPGPLSAALVQGTSVRAVFRSPGLAPSVVAPVLNAAQAMGLWQGGELTLFAAALSDLSTRCAYRPQVLAITGTNGKTTVTSLTGQLVARAGKSVQVAGNIGPTLLDTLTQALAQAQAQIDAQTPAESEAEVSPPSPAESVSDQAEPVAIQRHPLAAALPEVWVLELSSFQLDSSEGFEPTAATVLNVSQDHLDWHGDIPAYAAAKSRIFGAQTLMVLNREEPLVMAMRPAPVRAKLQKPIERECLLFGGDMPQRPGDFGIEVANGMAWLVRALEADETRRRRKDQEEELHIQRLIPADALRIRGGHNAVNALAALALASSAGCALGPMLYGLREYRGEPHRVEPVAIIDSVEFFDDSKGTNVGATVAALKGLGADRRIVVILGGEGKGQDFLPLADPVSRFARAVVLIGRDAPLIRAALQDTEVALHDAVDMPCAVSLAAKLAQSGDAVLMSPACASFDMFDHYEHRAEVFVQAVSALAETAGVAMEGGL